MLTEKEIRDYCDHLRNKYKDIKPEPRQFNRNEFDEYMEGSLNIYAVKVYRASQVCPSTLKLIDGFAIFSYTRTTDMKKAINKVTSTYGDLNTTRNWVLEVYNLEPNLDDEHLTLQEMNFKKVKDLNILLERKI